MKITFKVARHACPSSLAQFLACYGSNSQVSCVVSRLGQSKSCEAVTSSKESSSNVDVLRQPRGPDGTKGFTVTR